MMFLKLTLLFFWVFDNQFLFSSHFDAIKTFTVSVNLLSPPRNNRVPTAVRRIFSERCSVANTLYKTFDLDRFWTFAVRCQSTENVKNLSKSKISYRVLPYRKWQNRRFCNFFTGHQQWRLWVFTNFLSIEDFKLFRIFPMY